MSADGQLVGSEWRRAKDDMPVMVMRDPDRAGGSRLRKVLVRNTRSGQQFWISPKGLFARYIEVDGSEQYRTGGPR